MDDDASDLTKAGSGRGLSALRRTAYLCGLAAAIGLLALLVWPFDQAVSSFLRVSGQDRVSWLLWHAAQSVKLFGKGDVFIILGLVLAIYRRKQVVIAVLIAALIAGLIVAPTKLLVGRERPSGRDARSFPSGDAAAVAAFVVPVASAFLAMIPVVAVGIAVIGTAQIAT